MWKNNDSSKMISLLNTADIIINDFTLYYDDLFFCGQRLTSQGNYVGIIGHLNMNDFINNGNVEFIDDLDKPAFLSLLLDELEDM